MAFFGFKDLSSLSNVDMTIYRYTSDNSDKVIYMRVRDIAKNAHVSSSSVMRFIHKIGFASFPEFKAYIKNNQFSQTRSQRAFYFIDQNNFPKDIENRMLIVANLVFQSDNIITLGIGDSSFLAEYAARRMASLGFNTTAVTDPFYPLKSKLENTTNNILFVFTVSGETNELIELLNEFVNDDDVKTVCITSNENSTVAKMSRFVLSYHEKMHRLNDYYDLSSQVPVMYIVEGIDRLLENMVHTK